ncbi:glycosyltransferase family 4 protein [Methylosinus sporium]|uniref:Glycosyltransferase family 4 protein n=1 Tax=Methylosinus sporium TaxID=428 RepID=A0A549SXI7_METSR|nr:MULTISPECIES: glycosyltransferase family 4 protein [Methylosinus]MBU3890409.1 glycosyltransferase family 4 protein [Methylosinus sp. KRF6]TRL34330.1 glycosyltransferase family 4 protein [Methylosinus sporium]
MATDLTDRAKMRSPVIRLAMLSHYFETRRGGVEIVAGALARALSPLGFEIVWLATGKSNGGDPSSNLAQRELPASDIVERIAKIPYPLLFPSAFRSIFAQVRNADVVIVHDALYLTSVAAFFAARLFRKPLLVVQHIGVVPYRNPILRSLMAIANRLVAVPLLSRADQIVFISDLTRRYFEAIPYRCPPRLVFNGVDADIFSPPESEAERATARADLGLPAAGPIALFVGRFVEKKGLLRLERLARERPDILFVFAGWGVIDPAQWRLPNIRVYRNLAGASLAPLYRAADLLLLPSVGEGFPLVIQEALACGLPIVCGADTAAADEAAELFLTKVVIDDEAPRATAAALAAATSRLLEPDENPRRSRLARAEFCRSRYSWSASAERYATLLRRLVAHPEP